jgi:uncharacterized protein YjaZ
MTTRHRLSVITALLFLAARAAFPLDFERSKLVVNGQVFQIVTADAVFKNYLQRTDLVSDVNAVSKSLLLDPLAREILDGKAQAPFMFASVALPYQPDAFLKQETQLLSSAEVVSLIHAALPSITKSLPGPNTKIVVLPASPAMKPYLDKYGSAGYGATLGSGKIIIALDPTNPDWKAFLSYAIAHEYHHSAWISRNWTSPDFTLIDYLLFEGRADAFAKSLNPGFPMPADRYLTSDQEREVWKLIRANLAQKGSQTINDVMNGCRDIPFGSGYAIGYHIVRAFKDRNPSCDDATLVDVEAMTILAKSEYDH